MMLELNDIKMGLSESRTKRFTLLNGVNLGVEKGSVTALLGGNGAGKTTLFNIISGFEKGFQGRVLLEGKDITRRPPYRIARLGVGRLFQGRQLMDDLTLMENMKIASDDRTGERPFDIFLKLRRVKKSEIAKEQESVAVLTRLFGENNEYLQKLDGKASELSYGQQRLMALARLLMGDYRLLLLDEPTSGVNPEFIAVFCRIIRELVEKEGKTVLLIEHNMSFVREVADKCYYLSDGKILKAGTPTKVLEDVEVRKDYLGL